VYVSGLIAKRDANMKFVGTTVSIFRNTKHDVSEQLESIMESLGTILEESGSRLSNIVDVTVFLTNVERDFANFNRAYGTFFSEILPTRTTVEVSRLPSNVCIELKVIARKN